MKVLFDICHPAHVHFFKNPIRILYEEGHEIIVTSRHKEFTNELLDNLDITHESISSIGKGGRFSLLKELVMRDYRLYRYAMTRKPDIMAAIGGIFIAHVGKLTGIPSLVFYDTENAELQNRLTYPYSSRVIVPRCYQSWVPDTTIRYAGYHELSYLRPEYFKPDYKIALANGLGDGGDTFLVRLVSWKANHDIGEQGWNYDLVKKTVDKLRMHGSVLISSESPLPDTLAQYMYKGNPLEMHHVMAFCRGYIGESATMASESAVLGIPAVYAALTGRGYTDEEESKYGLVKNVRSLSWPEIEQAINWITCSDKIHNKKLQMKLLDDTIDVAKFVVDTVKSYPKHPVLSQY